LRRRNSPDKSSRYPYRPVLLRDFFRPCPFENPTALDGLDEKVRLPSGGAGVFPVCVGLRQALMLTPANRWYVIFFYGYSTKT